MSDDDTARVMAAVRAELARVPGASALADKIDVIVGEVEPFIEAAARVLASPDDAHATHEARSLAWLVAYRLGDQGFAPLAPAAVVQAWRSVAGDGARALADVITPLLLDGYARSREDKARAELQRALAEALPVSELAPGVLWVVVAGPLDTEGARTLAERAGAAMLRGDARAVLLELSGLTTPDASVLTELYGVVSAAKMLGAESVVCVASEGVRAAMREVPLPEGARRVETLAAGVEHALRAAGVSAGRAGVLAWFKRITERR